MRHFSRSHLARRWINGSIVFASAVLGLALPPSAVAGVGVAESFTGSPLMVSISVDSASVPGELVITLSVEGNDVIGDLRGVFFQVADESLLPGLSVSGPEITGAIFSANAVTNLGNGSNLNGGGSPCPCDIGLEIGTAGIGRDDHQSVTFTLMHASAMLDGSFLNGMHFGVRATSVGDPYGSREGSSKLIGVVPEPSTAILMLLGLGGLSSLGARGGRK